jgi:hypothetical protein
VSYTITNTLQLPLNDGMVRLPVLVIARQGVAHSRISWPLRPFSVAWNARSAFNRESEYSPELEIENSTGGSLAACLGVEWGGKKQERQGPLDANGSEVIPLKLALPLPAAEKTPFRQRLPLNFAVSANGVRQIFDRYHGDHPQFGPQGSMCL